VLYVAVLYIQHQCREVTLLIHEENSILQKKKKEKKLEHHLPIAVSDVTHSFVVVQASSISACE
jgi:hypothetical protein